MKIKEMGGILGIAVVMAWLVLASGRAWAATNEVGAMLQKGLFEEEANHNLDAAMQAYQAVITLTEKDRQFAATAIFRLGECYRKQGKTNEANVQYRRIVGEFSDQTELVKLSREFVGSAPSGTTFNDRLTKIVKQSPYDGEEGEINKIKAIIQDSPDLINEKVNGEPRLYSAVSRNEIKVVKFLLDNKADPNVKSSPPGSGESLSPLHSAVIGGNQEMVELLLSCGADINAAGSLFRAQTPQQEFTALHFATAAGSKAMVDLLLQHGAAIDSKNREGMTPLHLAAQKGFKTVAESLIAHHANVEAKNNNGETPLYVASAAGNKAVVELLLANKAEVNNDGIGLRNTALMAADRVDIAAILLEHGADVNAKNVYPNQLKWTALHFAVQAGSPEKVQLLLEHGADPDAAAFRNNNQDNGYTPLMLAAEMARKDLAQLLIAHKASLNAMDNEGQTALMRAANTDDKAMVTMLLDAKADSNVKSTTGEEDTVLTIAVKRGQLEIAELLLAHNAEVDTRNKKDSGVLHWAAETGPKTMVELLLAHGADVNMKDGYGRTPLDCRITKLNSQPRPMIVNFQSPGQSLQPSQPADANEDEIVVLLRKHGGVQEDEISTIRATRKAWGATTLPEVVFRKDTNSFNHFRLLEVIRAEYFDVKSWHANNYAGGGWLAFPDFTSIIITHRADEKSAKRPFTKVNLLNATNGFDASKDMLLEFGDVVEIPERVHALGESPVGLTEGQDKSLTECLAKSIKILVNGTATEIVVPQNCWLADFVSRQDVRNVLRSSSDLSRVKVKRADPITKKTEEIVVNTEQQLPQARGPEGLWMRDGDVVDVPEKR